MCDAKKTIFIDKKEKDKKRNSWKEKKKQFRISFRKKKQITNDIFNLFRFFSLLLGFFPNNEKFSFVYYNQIYRYIKINLYIEYSINESDKQQNNR